MVWRRIAAVLVFVALFASFGCAQWRLHPKEAELRKDLLVLRSEIHQFTLDKRCAPISLSDLVTSGYMKQLPTDPFTGKNDTWKFERIGALPDVHSGSDAIASDGTPYSLW